MTDMVKTRLQSGAKGFNGPIGAATAIYKNEGIRGFYRGTYAGPTRLSPSRPTRLEQGVLVYILCGKGLSMTRC